VGTSRIRGDPATVDASRGGVGTVFRSALCRTGTVLRSCVAGPACRTAAKAHGIVTAAAGWRSTSVGGVRLAAVVRVFTVWLGPEESRDRPQRDEAFVLGRPGRARDYDDLTGGPPRRRAVVPQTFEPAQVADMDVCCVGFHDFRVVTDLPDGRMERPRRRDTGGDRRFELVQAPVICIGDGLPSICQRCQHPMRP